jgi:hypothetical protein
MRARRSLSLLTAVLVAALLAGCVQSAGGAATDPRSGDGLRYGIAPQPDKGTTFQPNVVLVDGGASSIRSVTADGLTWTLSPSAGGISALKPGRVMFLTDRGVGKVMAVHTDAAGVEVTIGPVALTDVIRDGHFDSKNAVAISNPIALSAKGAFWADPALQQQAGIKAGSGADLPAVYRQVTGPVQTLSRPPSPAAIVSETAKASTGSFDVTGKCCSNGPSTAVAYDKNGLSMSGKIALNMAKPTANFRLDISGGKITSAGLTVRGSAGISASIHANTRPNSPTNGFSPPLGTDFAFSVPVGVFFGVPLNMVVTQTLNVQVNIPGQAVFNAQGKVKLGSTIGFSYSNGTFANTTSASLDTAGSLNGTNSIAVGISYASFSYNVRFTVGLGYLGFVVGLYLAFGVHLLSVVGAPVGFNIDAGAQNPIEACKSIQGQLWVDYGVGYTIPTAVADLVNYFLKAFQSDPIKASGGLGKGWTPVLDKYEVFPKSGFCTSQK